MQIKLFRPRLKKFSPIENSPVENYLSDLNPFIVILRLLCS